MYNNSEWPSSTTKEKKGRKIPQSRNRGNKHVPQYGADKLEDQPSTYMTNAFGALID